MKLSDKSILLSFHNTIQSATPVLNNRHSAPTPITARSRFLPDNFTLMLLATVALAASQPVSGQAAHFFEGLRPRRPSRCCSSCTEPSCRARRSLRASATGVCTCWCLRPPSFCFRSSASRCAPVLEPLVTPALYVGVLYLCVLPATVQSAIAFTAMGREATCRPPSAVPRPPRCLGLW